LYGKHDVDSGRHRPAALHVGVRTTLLLLSQVTFPHGVPAGMPAQTPTPEDVVLEDVVPEDEAPEEEEEPVEELADADVVAPVPPAPPTPPSWTSW
jgi:hypothetical protein